jgi:hypothetical protein
MRGHPPHTFVQQEVAKQQQQQAGQASMHQQQAGPPSSGTLSASTRAVRLGVGVPATAVMIACLDTPALPSR